MPDPLRNQRLFLGAFLAMRSLVWLCRALVLRVDDASAWLAVAKGVCVGVGVGYIPSEAGCDVKWSEMKVGQSTPRVRSERGGPPCNPLLYHRQLRTGASRLGTHVHRGAGCRYGRRAAQSQDIAGTCRHFMPPMDRLSG
jgi:hypothetical protein